MIMALKKTHAQFRAALRCWDEDNGICALDLPPADNGERIDRLRRVNYALWWFIENVSGDDPAHNDIFFELREMVRVSA
jgi:hypothetical protein